MLTPEDSAAELLIDVNGAQDSYRATLDVDGDGTNDSVYVETEDGGYAYTDTTDDGVADTLTQVDRDGVVTAQAVAVGDGEWQTVAPGSIDIGGGTDAAAAPGVGTGTEAVIVIDTPDGPAVAGTASYDTDGDGVNDTAVAGTVDGGTLIATDVDGDGSADLLTAVDAEGDFTSYEHTGDAEWTVVESGNLATDESGTAPTPATTDPATGRWVRG